MPELTISMPARNVGRFICDAIRSVLDQEGVDLELIVVDDASDDDTAEAALSFDDPRVRLLRNTTRRGIGFCHNRVLEESSSPIVAHVDADDVILPGALRKMVTALESNPNAGQAHCYFLDVDERLFTDREIFRQRWTSFHDRRPVGLDYLWELVNRGCVINHLRTYRRTALDEVGRFNEDLVAGVDYEMGLRIADRFEICLVPEFLYCYRIHSGNTSTFRRGADLRGAFRRHSILASLAKSGSVDYLASHTSTPGRVLLRQIWDRISPRRTLRLMRHRLRVHLQKAARSARRRSSSVVYSAYGVVTRLFSWWPLRWWRISRRQDNSTPKKLVYFSWQFPVLSQTFVQREVRGLQARGRGVAVISLNPAGTEHLDAAALALRDATHYLDLRDRVTRVIRYLRHFVLRHPLRCLNLFLYVILHRHIANQNIRENLNTFGLAVLLAGELEGREFNHLHAPWADRCAFVAMIAARLSGVPFTVQARAYDIHRDDRSLALKNILSEADGVITNSRYNQDYLRRLLAPRHASKVSLLYNNIELDRLQPPGERPTLPRPFRLLSVARLTPQKGIEHLLRACRILLDRGYELACRVVGGRVDPHATRYYLGLRSLQRDLGLDSAVSFEGALPHPEVVEAYRTTDSYVLPAVVAEDGSRDITPNAVIEAMAMELPVVVSEITAIPEIVEHEVSGLLVPPSDPDALADAIARLIEDPDLRRTLGRQARADVARRFDSNDNICGFEEFFDAVR